VTYWYTREVFLYQSKIPYTICRSGIYYFNYKHSDGLIRISLKTDSPRVARKLVKSLLNKIKMLEPMSKDAYSELVKDHVAVARAVSQALLFKIDENVKGIISPFSDSGDSLDDMHRYTASVAAESMAAEDDQIDGQKVYDCIMQDYSIDHSLDSIFISDVSAQEQAKAKVNVCLDHLGYESSRISFYIHFTNIYTQLKKVRSLLEDGLFEEADREFTKIVIRNREQLGISSDTGGDLFAHSRPSVKQESEAYVTFKEAAYEYLNKEFPRTELKDKDGSVLIWRSGKNKGKTRYSYAVDTDKTNAEWRNLELLIELGLGNKSIELKPKDVEGVFRTLDYLPQIDPNNLERNYEYAGFSTVQRVEAIESIKIAISDAGSDIDARFEVEQILYKTSSLNKIRQSLIRLLKDHFGTIESSSLVSACNSFKFSERYSNRKPFLIEETKRLIGALLESNNENFKFYGLVSIYTGMRPSEILRLSAGSVKRKEGIDYIEVLGGKSAAAKREIPIHSKLIEYGFLTFRSNRIQPLFDISEATVKRLWNQLQDSLNISRVSKGDIKTMYSNRTSFNSRLEAMKVDEDIRRLLVGHSQNGIQGKYAKQKKQDFSLYLSNAKAEIEKIDF
jgi:integrase